MKRIYCLVFSIIFSFYFSAGQNNQTNPKTVLSTSQNGEGFKNYDIFSSSSQDADASLRAIATDIELLDINSSVLLEIQNDKPNFIRFQIIHSNDTLSVKLQRHEILAENMIVRNQNDDILDYTPGLYYRGIVNGERESLAVFNFFNESLNGIISIIGEGNRNIGQLQDSSQYMIYTDSNMTVTQDFQCQVGDIEQPEDLIPQNEIESTSSVSANCVKVFYELTNDVFINNLSSVNNTMNWITSIHNIVATLYSNANIPTALSDVLIWQQADPYQGNNSENLSFFSDTRTVFNGDLAHLIDTPTTGGVAYLNSLCQPFRHAFSAVDMSFSQLPTYSWTINVVAHEMGHSLGSPHTHACFWNGNSTPIDDCGPDNGYDEGCVIGTIPPNGGTIMSYCHLDSTGVNLAQGFHPQVEAYMNTIIDTKSCLGTNCIDSCMPTVAGVDIIQTDLSTLTIDIDDVISNSWDYRIYEQNAFPPVAFTTTTSNSIVFNNIQPNTYYVIEVANNCFDGNYGSSFLLNYLSDGDWCSGITFADTGGLNDNYSDDENLIKTFYPNIPDSKVSLNINNFDIEEGWDFMTIYDGENTNAPIFADAQDMTGSFLPTTYFEATNPSGAITVRFTSDGIVNAPGWDITVSCVTLSTTEFTENEVQIYPNPFENEINLKSNKLIDEINIFDINGKTVYHKKISPQMKYKFVLNQLNSGMYLMTLKSGYSKFTQRIIKK